MRSLTNLTTSEIISNTPTSDLKFSSTVKKMNGKQSQYSQIPEYAINTTL